MKVLSKSLAAMVAAATLVGGGAFAVAGTAYAADNDAITVTPNPWYANSFDGWGTSLAWFANATGSLGEESAITPISAMTLPRLRLWNTANSCANSSTSPSSVMKDWT